MQLIPHSHYNFCVIFTPAQLQAHQEKQAAYNKKLKGFLDYKPKALIASLSLQKSNFIHELMTICDQDEAPPPLLIPEIVQGLGFIVDDKQDSFVFMTIPDIYHKVSCGQACNKQNITLTLPETKIVLAEMQNDIKLRPTHPDSSVNNLFKIIP